MPGGFDVAVSNVLVECLSRCSELPSSVASALASPSDHRVESGGYRFCLGGSVARVMVSGSVSFIVCGPQGTWTASAVWCGLDQMKMEIKNKMRTKTRII